MSVAEMTDVANANARSPAAIYKMAIRLGAPLRPVRTGAEGDGEIMPHRVSGIPHRGLHRELKLNLVVLADCEPTSPSSIRRSSETPHYGLSPLQAQRYCVWHA
jgi:hypothetical protein